MKKRYRTWAPGQQYLLPPSPHEWLPEDHLVYFLLDVVEELDLSAVEEVIQAKDARGTRPYAPHMMVALLLYGYCVGVFSSRKLEKATYENVAFRVLCGGCHPDHTRISEFRRLHLDALAGLFLQVLKLCQRAGLVKLGHVALDGTKIQANASKHKAMSYQRMKRMEARLEKEIADLLSRAEAADAAEDEQCGPGVRGDELPKELKRREDRLARIREAKAELEREARHARAAHLRELAEKNKERAEDEERPTKQRRSAATRAKNQEEQAATLAGDEEPAPSSTPEGLPLHRPKTTTDGDPAGTAQRNFTDPDSRIVESQGNFIQGYNCQIVADAAHQIILAHGVSNQAPDNGNLIPMLAKTVENCGRAPNRMSADTGYWTPDAPGAARELGTDVLIATERRKAYESDHTVAEGPPPKNASELEVMRHKLRTEKGRELYARRKVIVEPVHGQQKEVRGFRRFLLRGLEKVFGEHALLCAGHNLLKLYRTTVAGGLTPAAA